MRRTFFGGLIAADMMTDADAVNRFCMDFTEKFGDVTRNDIEFFRGKYELFNNRVLAIIDFVHFDDKKFIDELVDTMNQDPDTVISRQINPYMAFTSDLMENSCVFRRNKCKPVINQDMTECGHTWCLKFSDIKFALTQATRVGRMRVISVDLTGIRDGDHFFYECKVPIYPALYTDEQVRNASEKDLIEMRVRSPTQFLSEMREIIRVTIGRRYTSRRTDLELYELLGEELDKYSHLPSKFREFPRDVIIDIVSMDETGTCVRIPTEVAERMTPEEYRDAIMKSEIHDVRKFRHYYAAPTNETDAWRIVFPFLQKCGIAGRIRSELRTRDYIDDRIKHLHVTVSDRYVEIIWNPDQYTTHNRETSDVFVFNIPAKLPFLFHIPPTCNCRSHYRTHYRSLVVWH